MSLDRLEGLELLVRVFRCPDKYVPRTDELGNKTPVDEPCTRLGVLANKYLEKRR